MHRTITRNRLTYKAFNKSITVARMTAEYGRGFQTFHTLYIYIYLSHRGVWGAAADDERFRRPRISKMAGLLCVCLMYTCISARVTHTCVYIYAYVCVCVCVYTLLYTQSSSSYLRRRGQLLLYSACVASLFN
jgi:hypothetical protein